jgi:hypothetical protein
LEFYNDRDELISVTNDNYLNIFSGDELIVNFAKSDKEYKYYKIKLDNAMVFQNFINQKNNIVLEVSEKYDFTYDYTDWITNNPITTKKTIVLMDLIVSNNSENRIWFQGNIIYYKNNKIVDVDTFTNYALDLGKTVIKNPKTQQYYYGDNKVINLEYDSYRVIYTAQTNKY